PYAPAEPKVAAARAAAAPAKRAYQPEPKSRTGLWIGIVAVLLLAAAGGVWYWKTTQAAVPTQPVAAAPQFTEDQRIQLDVRDKLADLAQFKSVEVAAKDGVVTLAGNVPTEDDAKMAENLARGRMGVKNVLNQLKVGNAETPEAVTTAEPEKKPETKPVVKP